MKRIILYTLTVAMALASCAKIEQGATEATSSKEGTTTIRVQLDQTTRVAIESQVGSFYKLCWEEGDKISVNGHESNPLTAAEAGSASAEFTFSPALADGDLYAVYPASAVQSYTDGAPVVAINKLQSYGTGSWNDNPTLMVAKGTLSGEETDLQFTHAFSYLQLNVQSASKALKTIYINGNGQTISGNYTINCETAEISASSDVYSAMAYSFATPTTNASFFVAIPAQTYANGISIRMVSDDGFCQQKKMSTYSAVAGGVRKINDSGLEYTTFNPTVASNLIASAYDWEAFALANSVGLVADWVDATNTVKLSADIATTSNFTRIMTDFSKTFDGDGHSISQGASIVPLFTKITAAGAVKNLVLKGELATPAYPSTMGTAAICQYNYGTIQNVESQMTLNMDKVKATTIFSGLTVYNAGAMNTCSQTGDFNISYDCTSAEITSYIGGLACFASDNSAAGTATAVGSFTNCSNSANISVRKTNTNTNDIKKFAIGGICSIVHYGTSSKYSVFDGCTNTGNLSRIDAALGMNYSHSIGGIVGRVANAPSHIEVANGYYAQFTNCSNSGTLDNASLVAGQFATTISIARLSSTGGIVGSALGLEANKIEFDYCSNTGSISGCSKIKTNSSSGTVLGGLIGTASNVQITNCTSQTQNIDTQSTFASKHVGVIGGLIGQAANIVTIQDSKAYLNINAPSSKIYSNFASADNQCYGLAIGAISNNYEGTAVTIDNCGFGGIITATASAGLSALCPKTLTLDNICTFAYSRLTQTGNYLVDSSLNP